MCTSVKAGKLDAPSLVPAQTKWSTAARTDIQGIYVTLRDNHPGPVDSTNPSFARWLMERRERALEEAATLQIQALTFHDRNIPPNNHASWKSDSWLKK